MAYTPEVYRAHKVKKVKSKSRGGKKSKPKKGKSKFGY